MIPEFFNEKIRVNHQKLQILYGGTFRQVFLDCTQTAENFALPAVPCVDHLETLFNPCK